MPICLTYKHKSIGYRKIFTDLCDTVFFFRMPLLKKRNNLFQTDSVQMFQKKPFRNR